MRVVSAAAELPAALAAARRTAVAATGDGTLLVERYVPRPRHIEFQVLGDSHGRVMHLGERECSLQRRHQKIIEEAPSPLLSAAQRAVMGGAAVAATALERLDGALASTAVLGLTTNVAFLRELLGDPDVVAVNQTVRTPMPGTVLAVHVSLGQAVTAGQPVLVVEALKMEHTVTAPVAGVVAGLTAKAGRQVRMDETLAVIGPEPADGGSLTTAGCSCRSTIFERESNAELQAR
jgi:acetyl-CoA/propionyl-CoA carboxylase, biotin carboxylase, biotin carboxyl carrier protein